MPLLWFGRPDIMPRGQRPEDFAFTTMLPSGSATLRISWVLAASWWWTGIFITATAPRNVLRTTRRCCFFQRTSFHPIPAAENSGKPEKVDGKGLTVNIPLLAGCGDGEYVALFEKILRPIALEFDAGASSLSVPVSTSILRTPGWHAGDAARLCRADPDLFSTLPIVLRRQGSHDP